ncbi:MAG: hypothetical protein M1838_004515 [Thelocarpon superellum]|nr:MAG: hypothetical protein M1838_004515 [Thelocarpon superellum]
MKAIQAVSFVTLLSCTWVSSTLALNILVTNDDGFGSANIREFYKALNAAGHNAWIVAPVVDNSGKGGTVDFTREANLTRSSMYNLIPSGAPSFGTDPKDSQIWYYNGTPAACTFFALDYVVKNFWNGTQPDLLVSGPNEGSNLGPFLYTLSGTMGATYAAVARGIPAIAFSAMDGTKRSYTYVNASAPGGKDPATITGELGVQLVNQLASSANGGRLLPLGYGLSVNYPEITSLKDDSCIKPPFINSRLTGMAETDTAAYNASTGLFTYQSSDNFEGDNVCLNGNCTLPGETDVVKTCQTAMSVFTIDYDAPTCQGSQPVRELTMPLVRYSTNESGNTKDIPAGTTIGDVPSSSPTPKSGGHGVVVPSTFSFLGLFCALFSLV